MKLTDEWFTAVAESRRNGNTIFITGRTGLQEFRLSGKFGERVEVTWSYDPDAKGMPGRETSEQMEEVLDVLRHAMERDKLAILTGIYTGDGERTMVFYTRNIPAYGERLNAALAPYEQLPLSIYTEKDASWDEYAEMCEAEGTV